MPSSSDRIVRSQNRKKLRAWLEIRPEEMSALEQCLANQDGPRVAERFSGCYLKWLSPPELWGEVEEILQMPPPTAEFLSITRPELHFRVKEISPNLLRSCQPKEEHLRKMIAERGLQLVVNLREESDRSRALCEQLGLEYERISVVDHKVPGVSQVQHFLRVVEGKKTLVHCMAGRGRTGIFVTCYRVHHGISMEDAIRRTESEVQPMRENQRDWLRRHAEAF